jgi:adenosylhomocysteine nucleosidase
MKLSSLIRFAILAGLPLLVAFRPSAGQEPSAPVTGILGAFSDELALLEGAVTDPQPQQILGIRFVTGKLKGRKVVIASSGVGKVNAGVAAALLIEHFKPHEILYSGIAGGINPELRPGDVVIAVKTVQHDLGILNPEGIQLRGARNPVDWRRNPVFFDADPRLLNLAESVGKGVELGKIKTSGGERSPRVIRGIVATGDVFVASPAKRDELRKTLKADAVEMEGAAVAQICYQLAVPCLVIRSISDTADAKAFDDKNEFLPTAARNSALLVTAIIEQLASPTKK